MCWFYNFCCRDSHCWVPFANRHIVAVFTYAYIRTCCCSFADGAFDCGDVYADCGRERARESGNLPCSWQQRCYQCHARRTEQGLYQSRDLSTLPQYRDNCSSVEYTACHGPFIHGPLCGALLRYHEKLATLFYRCKWKNNDGLRTVLSLYHIIPYNIIP